MRSLLKQVLDSPVDALQRIGKPPPRLESLRLYREVLKFSREFDWQNEKGQHWKHLIQESARKEFELARDEKDALLVMKMIITSREAIQQTRDKLNKKQHELNEKLSSKEIE